MTRKGCRIKVMDRSIPGSKLRLYSGAAGRGNLVERMVG